MTTDDERYARGERIRRDVMGDARVDTSMANANDFDREYMEHYITALGWGEIWAREGLTRPQRSLLCLGMLGAMQRLPEFKAHVRGAINNGVSVDELREVMIQISGYCGMPAGISCFRAAREVLDEMTAAGEL